MANLQIFENIRLVLNAFQTDEECINICEQLNLVPSKLDCDMNANCVLCAAPMVSSDCDPRDYKLGWFMR